MQSSILIFFFFCLDNGEHTLVHYYISSLQATAESFAKGIRGHWGIENLVHWVKAVVMGEDPAPFAAFNAATNWSIIRNMVINIARHNGYHSLTKAR